MRHSAKMIFYFITLFPFCCSATIAATLPERNLSDFHNADGRSPDGKDSRVDDSEALHQAIAVGPGIVRIGPGWYRFGDISVPQGVTVVGAGSATIIRSNGSSQIFRQAGLSQWRIRDLVLDGETVDNWHNRKDQGRRGVLVEKCFGFEISGLIVQRFDGPAIEINSTDLGPNGGDFCDGGVLDRITATQNFIGIRFNKRAEYVHATRLTCHQNVTGVVIHGGNIKLGDSNICSNIDGLLIEDKENGSHGAIANCLFNHNERNALWAKNVAYGMAFSNNCFFYGRIVIEDSVGVNIQGGQISCSVLVSGKGVNRMADNYVIPEKFQFNFTPTTIVQNNFTATGPWGK
jgi:hypothetical protein